MKVLRGGFWMMRPGFGSRLKFAVAAIAVVLALAACSTEKGKLMRAGSEIAVFSTADEAFDLGPAQPIHTIRKGEVVAIIGCEEIQKELAYQVRVPSGGVGFFLHGDFEWIDPARAPSC